MNYDFDTLYNECKRDCLAEGKSLFYDSAVKNILVSQDNAKRLVTALVNENKTGYSTKIVFDENGGLYDYGCECGEADMQKGPCRHVVATALSYEEKHPESENNSHLEPKSDADVTRLIFDYLAIRKNTAFRDELLKAELTPYVNVGEGVTLTFTVGYRKQYIVRDLAAFLADFKECKFKRYGVALELYHTPGNFTEQSNKLIRFLTKCMAERGAAYLPKNPSAITLTPSETDKFFSLYEGRLVGKTKSEHWAFASAEAAFPMRLAIDKASGGYLIKTNCKKVDFLPGSDYVYAIIGNRVFRLEEDFYLSVNPVCEVLKGGRELFVSDSDMVRFYNAVVKKVEKYLPVDSAEDLSTVEIPPLKCKIYLECREKTLIADVKASYNDQQFDITNDNYTTQHLRDWDSEDGIRLLLAKYFPSYPTLEISDESTIFEFLKNGVRELCSYAEVFMAESMERMRIRSSAKMRVGVKLRMGVLSLAVSSEQYSDEEMRLIMEAYRAKQRYVLLGGGFVDLDDRSLDAINEVLKEADEGADGNYVLPAYYASYVGEELRENGIEYDRDDSFEQLVNDLSGQNDVVSDLSPSLGKTLREYQKVGYNWLKKLSDHGFGGILADDMGLGKTLQVLSLISRKKNKAIIVCPTTLLLNWQDEIKKFTPWLSSVIVMGSQPERKEMVEKSANCDVIITSYDLIRRDYELYENVEFDFAIADEAQNIKNPETKNAQAVKKLRAKTKFALTGTPVENHLGELWSIFDFVMPGFLGEYEDFKLDYEEAIVAGDEDVAEKFRKLIMPFVLRRLKSEVLKELPPKVESKITVIAEGEQKSLYAANMHQLKNSLAITDNPNRVEVLSMIMRLRELCCHPSLVYPDYNGNSAKLDSCMELIASAVEGGHKVLLFSQFTSMLEIIQKRLAMENITFYKLTGENPKTERLRLVKQFNEDDTNVFLISLKAGGTGLNLTGADIVIHYDPWWNESVMNQATDRAYRLGQNKSVHVYKLILGGTLEESIYELQQKKSALSNMVVGAENNLKDIIKLIREDDKIL